MAKAAVVRFCQLDALAHGTCGARRRRRTPKAARKTAREVVRRTLLAKGSGRLSKDKNGTMGEGAARARTLPKEKDAPADVDGATVAPPQRRRTPSMYLGGARGVGVREEIERS